MSALMEWFYSEVKSGDWTCPNGCVAGGYFGPWGAGCGTCGWGKDADPARLPHAADGDPCRWDGLPRLAEPHCGWRDAEPADAGLLHEPERAAFHD